jgi:hypothetical protein
MFICQNKSFSEPLKNRSSHLTTWLGKFLLTLVDTDAVVQ